MKKLVAVFAFIFTLMIPIDSSHGNFLMGNRFIKDQVIPEFSFSRSNLPILRLHNYSNQFVSCRIEEENDFHVFMLRPYHSSLWYVVRGEYWWDCRSAHRRFGPMVDPH